MQTFHNSSRTSTINRIDQDWIQLCQSSKTRRELQSMIQESELLYSYTPRQIIQIIGNTRNAPVEERDMILGGLFPFVDSSELACRMILHSLRPQIVHLVQKTLFADAEERASTILSIASERILSWRPKTHNFCHLSLYRSIARTTKAIAEKWEKWEVAIPPGKDCENEPFLIDILIKWIADEARVDYQTASMVVLTRCEYYSIQYFSEQLGEDPKTLRQRRLRVEKQIREFLKNEGLNKKAP